MIIIGEKINGAIPSAAEAIAKQDDDFILKWKTIPKVTTSPLQS